MKPIKEKNSSYTPFVFDGAFGTYYHKKGSSKEQCEMANINDQEAVYAIHKEYIASGVDAIKTNTFGANSKNYPDLSQKNTIIKNGFEIATLAAKDSSVKVFADIGYYEEEILDLLHNEYTSIAETFLSLGATNFIFETQAEYEPILPAISIIKEANPDAFIIVSFAVSQDGYTRNGLYYKNLLRQASENPHVDVCGLNCICGPNHIYQLLSNMERTGKPLCAMPNSGYPATVNGRTVFQDNARYFASKILELYQFGVLYLGGCCGTTPDHMRCAIELIRESQEINAKQEKEQEPKQIQHQQQQQITQTVSQGDIFGALPGKLKTKQNDHDLLTNKSVDNMPVRVNLFKDKIADGKPVIAVELDPPIDADVTYLMEAALKAKKAGADIITIADSPLARTRADSIILAAKVKREVGIDVLPHLSCRDRNYISLKGALLGAAIENINNILVVTGDPIAQTDRGDMKGVFSYNSFQLISFIKSMNKEVLPQSPLHIAAAINVNSAQFQSELKRTLTKIDKGAELFLTQPLYSKESVENAIEAKKTLNTRILFGIMPVASYKNALFLNNEVAGIQIPKEFVDTLYDKTPQDVSELSLDFCMEIVRKTINHADGYYLMTPLKKIDLVCELIRRIRETGG